MPTYEYACKACKHRFEEFQSIKASPLKKCPECGKAALERLIGTGAALIFKGSGFYQTDYRSESYKKAAEADSKAATPAADSKPSTGGEAKAEPKEAGKSESSAAPKAEPKPAKAEAPKKARKSAAKK